MKTKIANLIVLILVSVVSVKSQETFSVYGTKLTYSLIEKWISEYTKENPQVHIKLIKNKNESAKVNISIIAHKPAKDEINSTQRIVYMAKYALLPVTCKNEILLKNIKKRGLNKEELEKLYFDDSKAEENNEKSRFPVTVYAQDNQSCSALTFANYFGYKSSDIKGKRIAGDEIFLLTAIKRDTSGITFNTLGNIYDKNTRKLNIDVSLLPLNLGKDAASAFNNVDDALKLLEADRFETIPVENIGFIYNHNSYNIEIVKFLRWVLTNGNKFNHEYGYLNLDKDLLANQLEYLENSILSSK